MLAVKMFAPEFKWLINSEILAGADSAQPGKPEGFIKISMR